MKQKDATCQRKGNEEEEPLIQRDAEETISHLIDMGFGPDEAREAMRLANNNLHQATVLLAQQSLDTPHGGIL